MTLVILGLVLFLGVHVIPTLPGLRDQIRGRLGAGGYRAMFVVGSILGFVLLVYGYSIAPVIQVWNPPVWTRHIAVALMLPVFVFIIAAYWPGRIKQTLRHPFLVGVKLWALAHLLANGDLASMILFLSILAFAVYDRISLKRRGDPMPVPAQSGPLRNDIVAIAAGLVVYVVFLLYLHRLLIGVSPLA